jgi:3-phenylpropionate/cinnamic acid dioxygenase small subunit
MSTRDLHPSPDLDESRDAIQGVLVRYARAVDTRDWTLFRSCFTSDVIADYGEIGSWKGIESLAEFMIQGHLGMGRTQHLLTNFHMEIEDDRADTTTYVHSVTVLASHLDDWIDTIGTYEDQFVRQTGEWRIARRTFRTTRLTVSPSLTSALRGPTH